MITKNGKIKENEMAGHVVYRGKMHNILIETKCKRFCMLRGKVILQRILQA
jgi:hypothetical protein